MSQHLALFAIIVPTYDEAIAYYVETLGFELTEDTPISSDKRWVVVTPPGSQAGLLLARAANDRQRDAMGDQAGGRVLLFLHTDDFQRDYDAYHARGVRFIEEPRLDAYGRVVVFEDVFGNRWDLIERPAA